MAATFRDGIEAAAALVEARVGMEICAEFKSLAELIRSIQEPAEPLDAIADGFQQFKAIWPKGPRNHWTPALKAFRAAVKTRKHKIAVILAGVSAYAATRPEFQYVPAPAVFLNQDRFLTDYRPNGRAPTGNKSGASSLFDLEQRLSGPEMREGR